ncbi:MAG: DUF4286 family protein [Gemmataceae bacterium]
MMAEIRYTVSVTFPREGEWQRWLDWLKTGHAAAVIAGGATSAEAYSVDGSPNTFEVVYRFPDRATFERYEREVAPALRAEGLAMFPASSGIVFRRSLAELLARIP